MSRQRAPNGAASREVRATEDILGLLHRAEVIARALGTRMIQRARTEDEAANVRDINDVRVTIEQVRRLVVRWHPNRIEEDR